MKFRLACLSLVFGLSSLAFAKLPLPNDALGKIEAALDHCARVNPKDAPAYQDKKKILIQGASGEEVAKARSSKEYQDAHEQVAAELGQEPVEQTAKTCAAALKGD